MALQIVFLQPNKMKNFSQTFSWKKYVRATNIKTLEHKHTRLCKGRVQN